MNDLNDAEIESISAETDVQDNEVLENVGSGSPCKVVKSKLNTCSNFYM